MMLRRAICAATAAAARPAVEKASRAAQDDLSPEERQTVTVYERIAPSVCHIRTRGQREGPYGMQQAQYSCVACPSSETHEERSTWQRTASSRRGKRSPLRAAARAAPARGARRAQLPKSRSPVVAGSAGLTKKYKKGLRARRGCNARAGRARGKCKRHLQPAAKSSAKHAAWQSCRLAMPAFQKN